ncbi:hypothetical protein J1P26_22010 [Neobacillus sp. MM2021_6]|uniref:hypothetical protein n=1 Tax=Bacillaceae TaxID=186817 RepID=UPI001409B751|nr:MULTISPECIES: hypothetical protein [Bacillaceae]MBO0962383.1 hypothetical protein [Neobacillus sp. MM2021_6]NHC20863.1 hypothetical protein [Bacillus sp. MM2020_4]
MGFLKNLFNQPELTQEEKDRVKEEKERIRQEKIKKGQEKLEQLQQKMQELDENVELEHLGGYPKIKAGKTVKIKKSPGQNQINFGSNVVTVKAIEWSEKGKRSAGKAAAGAIAGGLLTGGVGLIAGAAIGGRKKDDSIVALLINENGIDYTVYFRADQKEYQELASLL